MSESDISRPRMKRPRMQSPRMQKSLEIVLLILIVSAAVGFISYAVFVGISSSQRSRTYKVIVIGKTNQKLTFWNSLRDGIDTAADEYNVTYEYWGPDTESDVDVQIKLVYKAISEKPDAIVLAATDYEKLAQPAKAITDAHIVLITLDSNVYGQNGPIGSGFVATDNVAAGVKAGQEMTQLLPEGKKVAVISHQIHTKSSIDRDAGVRQGLNSGISVLSTVDADGSEQKAYELAADILKDTSVGGIVCLNEYSTTGAARAIMDAGLSGRVVLVGFDSSTDLIHYLESGCLSATVIQRPFTMGYIAMVQAVEAIKGKKVTTFYDTGSILVTKATMYLEENEKLLFPFT